MTSWERLQSYTRSQKRSECIEELDKVDQLISGRLKSPIIKTGFVDEDKSVRKEMVSLNKVKLMDGDK